VTEQEQDINDEETNDEYAYNIQNNNREITDKITGV